MGVPSNNLGTSAYSPQPGFSKGGFNRMDPNLAFDTANNERAARAVRRQILLGLGTPNEQIRAQGLLHPGRFAAYDPIAAMGANPLAPYGAKGGKYGGPVLNGNYGTPGERINSGGKSRDGDELPGGYVV